MFEDNELIKNRLIDRKRLILQTYQNLNIKDEEVILLLKILFFLDYEEITIDQIKASLLDYNSELDVTLASLINKKLIKTYFKKNNKAIFLDFRPLWKAALNIYSIPLENSPFSDKLNWFCQTLNFDKSLLISDKLKTLIESDGWDKILEIVLNIKQSELENITWAKFKEIYKGLSSNKNLDKKNIKNLIEINWLED